MKRNIYFVIAISLFMLIIYPKGFTAGEVVEFGNTTCPISGEKIIEDEAVKYEYNGVVYNFCCKMCLKDFKKDPEKYIKILEASKEKEKETHTDTHEHHHH